MEEIRIINHAKGYLEKLAAGINPLDGKPVNKTDVVCEERIRRCLLYAADVFGRIAESRKIYDNEIYIQRSSEMKNEAVVVERAHSYIENLAVGINPLTKKTVENGDIVKNKNITKCLRYVSDTLGKILLEKLPFDISEEALEDFDYSDEALKVTDITKRINSRIDTTQMTGINPGAISNYLVGIQLLEKKVRKDGKTFCITTKIGEQLGLTQTYKEAAFGGSYGPVLYSRKMQEFVIKNITAIIEKSRNNNVQEKNTDEQQ